MAIKGLQPSFCRLALSAHSQESPLDHLNQDTLFSEVDMVLTYAPRYGATHHSPPDRAPEPASFEDPDDGGRWLFSVDRINAVRGSMDLAVCCAKGMCCGGALPDEQPGGCWYGWCID